MEESLYEEYAEIENSHWWFEGRRRIFDALLNDLELGPDVRIVDLGCGTGTNLELLSHHGRVTGIDFGAAAVRFTRERGFDVLRADATRIPLADDSVDLVTALDLVEHLPDDAACTREMVRVCRPGGTLLWTVPAYPWLWGRQDRVSQHRRRYRRSEFRDLIEGTGVEVRLFTSINSLLLPAVAAVRGFRRVVPEQGEPRSDFHLTGPPAINRLLGRVLGAEAWAVRRFPLPAGVSLLCLARKPEGVAMTPSETTAD